MDAVNSDGWRVTQEFGMEGVKMYDRELGDEVGGRQYRFIPRR